MTLYVGARTSDTFWRLYDKTDKALRCEVELKGELARRAYTALRGGENLSGIWNRFLLRSKVPKIYTDYFRSDTETSELPDLTELPDMGGKCTWLATLDSLVYKLLNDHDTEERTRTIIARWATYGGLIDSGPT